MVVIVAVIVLIIVTAVGIIAYYKCTDKGQEAEINSSLDKTKLQSKQASVSVKQHRMQQNISKTLDKLQDK